ncbi:MAG: hypothetical protein ABR969_00715 [Sedimentisphaerales bacterium]|jgi:hypothetical protein
MNEQHAKKVADAFGGRAWQSGGGIWLVLIDREDGKLVVVSDETVCEYGNEKKFEKSKPTKTILLH